jgi:1,2-diacylglycerol 3-alpha-glucosyltransferase
MMPKVIICYTHYTPRQVRRIQCLAERIPNLIAIEIAGSERVYPWWNDKYNIDNVRQVQLFKDPLESLTQKQIIKRMKEFLEYEKPDVAIISDYSRKSMRFIASWVKKKGGKTVLPAVTWAGDHQRLAIKEILKGLIIRRLFDATCATGERSKEYFISLGFSKNQIWKQFNVIDNNHFANGAEIARQNGVTLRKKLNIPEKYFLYVGALEPWKNVPHLLDCYVKYRKEGGNWGLVIVGVGSQYKELQQKIEIEVIPDVFLTGIKKHDEIPLYYGLATCLVVPSLSEPWGLVINEAAAAALPILASDKCGCVPELVHRGINGYVFEPEDKNELVRLMHLMSGGTLDLYAMGESSRKIIEYYTPERWADALADCVNYLLVN